MRIGILGDMHLRATKPINRIDNYYEKQFEKLSFAFDIFKQNECEIVLQPGDFFHNYGKDPYSITYDAIAFLILKQIPVYLVIGQHDVKFHNTELTDIPIQILNKTSLVTKLEQKPIKMNDVYLYGKSWNEQWPEKVKRSRKSKNILVLHSMVINDNKLWAEQTEYITAKKLAEQPYDLIVCGDNHHSFIFENKVINCGSLMRMNSDQINHRPMFVIYDTESGDLHEFLYPVESYESVFRFDQRKEDKLMEDEKRQVFVKSLNDKEFESELNSRENIHKVLKKKRCRQRTKDIIEESLIGAFA
jgi:DNA repair exonuclease SbcCD nuclease subunit